MSENILGKAIGVIVRLFIAMMVSWAGALLVTIIILPMLPLDAPTKGLVTFGFFIFLILVIILYVFAPIFTMNDEQGS